MALLLLLGVSTLPVAGCASDGVFEEAGDDVDEALDDTGDAIEDAGDEIEDALD